MGAGAGAGGGGVQSPSKPNVLKVRRSERKGWKERREPLKREELMRVFCLSRGFKHKQQRGQSPKNHSDSNNRAAVSTVVGVL